MSNSQSTQGPLNVDRLNEKSVVSLDINNKQPIIPSWKSYKIGASKNNKNDEDTANDPNANNPHLLAIRGLPVVTRVRGYCRVSTEMQVEDGYSLDNQEKSINEYAKRNNWVVVKIYFDKGISGKECNNRPGLLQLLDECEPHDVVLTPSLSRLGRNREQMDEIIKIFKKKNTRLVIMDMNIDTSNEHADVWLTLMSMFNQIERQEISKRVSSVMRRMEREGKLRHRPRFGYKLYVDNETKERYIVPNEEEQATIELIRKFVRDDPEITIAEICRQLEKHNIVKLKGCKKIHWTTIDRIVRDNGIPIRKNQNSVNPPRGIAIEIEE